MALSNRRLGDEAMQAVHVSAIADDRRTEFPAHLRTIEGIASMTRSMPLRSMRRLTVSTVMVSRGKGCVEIAESSWASCGFDMRLFP